MAPSATRRRMIPGLESSAGPQTLTLRMRTVLVVDEALPVRRKLLDTLHRAGVAASEVILAQSAEEALEAFATRHPSLVLCELVGAPQEGLQMVLEMLSLDPQAKVVLVTAEDPASPFVRQAVRAGVFGVVRKPLRHEAVRSVLAEIEAEETGIERFR